MRYRRYFLLLTALIALFIATFIVTPFASVAWAPAAIEEPDPHTKQTILAATMVLNFLRPVPGPTEDSVSRANGDERLAYYEGSSGLASLVLVDGEVLILTHDHWHLYHDRQLFVEFQDAEGRLLDTISGAMFRSLVRYRDGGTMLLDLPPALNRMGTGLQPARLRARAEVPLGGTVQFVGRAGRELTVEPLVVIDRFERSNKSYLEFRSPGGYIVRPGNSGGGVWYEGELVANISSTIQKQDGRPTAKSRAALTPAAAIQITLAR